MKTSLAVLAATAAFAFGQVPVAPTPQPGARVKKLPAGATAVRLKLSAKETRPVGQPKIGEKRVINIDARIENKDKVPFSGSCEAFFFTHDAEGKAAIHKAGSYSFARSPLAAKRGFIVQFPTDFPAQPVVGWYVRLIAEGVLMESTASTLEYQKLGDDPDKLPALMKIKQDAEEAVLAEKRGATTEVNAPLAPPPQ